MIDPCACDQRCRHEEKCFAGHANYPNRHWYPCDICTPSNVTYRLADGRYLTVLVPCGHAVGPHVRSRDAAYAGLEHRRNCETASLRTEDIERLAWHLFTEGDDMDHPPTAELARRVWENPCETGHRAGYLRKARRYLEIATGLPHHPEEVQ